MNIHFGVAARPDWCWHNCLHAYKRDCWAHHSSANGFESSMVEPLSPASFATCNNKSCQLKILHTQSTNATATTHLTQGCWPTPSIVLSRCAQRQHDASCLSVFLILGQLPQFLVDTGRPSKSLVHGSTGTDCHGGGLVGLKQQLEPMHRWECCGLGT